MLEDCLMSDFTKDELIYLKDGIAMLERCEMNSLLRKKLEELWVKTSQMIDSYCEHECQHEFERRLMQIDLCDKCKNFKFVFTTEFECQHESDGRSHCKTPTTILSSSIAGSLPAGFPKMNKCKKCGEFYR